MARKRVRLAWIANDSARRATFKKRRKGLMKKVRELSILCGIQSCAIVYGPYESSPMIWPSPDEASGIITRFLSLSDQAKKTLNQELFMELRIGKAKEQLKRMQMENQAMESNILLNRCLLGHHSVDNLDMETLSSLLEGINAKINAVNQRIETLTANPNNQDLTPKLDIDASMALIPAGCQEIVPHSLAEMVDMNHMIRPVQQVLDGELGYFDPSSDLLMKRRDMVMYNPQVFVPPEDGIFSHYLPQLMQFPCLDDGGSSAINSSSLLVEPYCFHASCP